VSGAGTGARRPERVAERIKMELMDLLLRGAVRDPAAAGACVTDVKVSDDLGHARVYVRLLRDSVSEKAQSDAVLALNRAAGFLRKELSPRLKLKYQPDLRFFWDEGVDQAARIESLLSEIEREGAGK
jgi:ribosome-binding factor A